MLTEYKRHIADAYQIWNDGQTLYPLVSGCFLEVLDFPGFSVESPCPKQEVVLLFHCSVLVFSLLLHLC